MKNDIKFISERISYRKTSEETTIIITGKIERSKESLLLAWILAWSFCGILILIALFGDYPREQKLYFVIFLSFWTYFEYKVIYVFRYRKWGKEYLRIADGKLTIKRSISKIAKANEYFIENIRNLSIIEKNNKSFFQQLEKSFWTIGDEGISFEYLGKFIKLGIQLDEVENKKLLKFLKEELQVK